MCVTQLLSHLLFLTANGGLSGATALPDTFTTAGFVAAALAAELPPEFVEDVERRWGDPLPAGGKVFDLFRSVVLVHGSTARAGGWGVAGLPSAAVTSDCLEWRSACTMHLPAR